MPTEMRKIVFSEEEIVKAVLSQNRHSVRKLPPGDIVQVKAKSAPEPLLELDIFDPESEATKTIKLDTPYLAAAMLRFCIDSNIPIPRVADKSVQILGGSIALNISIDAGTTSFAV